MSFRQSKPAHDRGHPECGPDPVHAHKHCNLPPIQALRATPNSGSLQETSPFRQLRQRTDGLMQTATLVLCMPSIPQALSSCSLKAHGAKPNSGSLQETSPFRQSRLRMNGVIQNVSLVLCNDQPQTFGAPDVLQLTAADLAVQFAQHCQFPDRPPSQVRCRL